MKKPNNLQRTILRTLLLLAALAPVTVWGQDYSGVYYIGSRGYVEANTTTNFYLCPTEGWAFYVATNNVQAVDNGQPFLTTFQYRDGNHDTTKAIWIVEKEPNSGCYYIKQALTGKYIVSNGVLSGAGNTRARVHLETVANASALTALGDWALFEITYDVDHYDIIPHSTYGRDGADNIYLVVNTNNYNQLTGTNNKTNGPTGFKNCGGIIGLYTHPDNGNAKFYFEDAVKQPVISQAANGDITITCATGNTTIYYTLNGDDPVVPADGTTDPTDPNTYKYSTTFSPAIGSTGVKAVAVLSNMHAAVSKKAEFTFTAYTTPTITFNNTTNEASISSEGTVYYTTDGEDPAVDPSLIYSDPFTITSTTTVKAIAIHSGYLTSDIATTTIDKVATPVITPLTDGTVEITCATPGATIRYEMGASPSNPTTSSTTYTDPINGAAGKVIKAFAAKEEWINSEVKTSETIVFTCATPVISKTDATHFTITCSFPISGVSIYYTTNGDTPTASSTLYEGTVSFSESDLPMTVKAIAVATDYNNSAVATKTILAGLDLDNEDNFYIIATNDDFNKFIMMVNAEGAGYNYKITNDITVQSGTDPTTESFTGVLKGVVKSNGALPVVSGLDHPLFNTLNGGTVKNLMLDNVSISGGTNAGAICNEATGNSRIYNCGVLATNSTVEKDDDGYDHISSCSSTISGSGYVGGLVGLLDGTSRVINCFSYANVSGGSYVGGIVGYNNIATTATNLKTMVMNCMFYGEVSGTSIAPIYNGQIITNVGNNTGVSNFNYFRLESDYIQDTTITKVYHCALGAETRFLQRFEFFRHLLNSNRVLAAWWVNSTSPDTSEIMKWVMIPDSIGTTTPYPILKKWGKYPSVVNYDAAGATTGKSRNQGGKLGTLTVNIQMGSGGAVYTPPTGAAITNADTILIITDKDTAHYNFNYYKVQLPYYNEVGSKNYTGYRVVTGWKIVSITGGTPGTFTASDTWGGYNFADRNCTNKDLYGTGGSNRIFNQGAYWDVPEGVTAITIEPYWAKCAYLADPNADKVYNQAMETGYDVPNVGGGQKYINGDSYSIAGDNQVVFTTIGNAIASSGTGNALFQGVTGSPGSQTVYDYAVVLVGNYHHSAFSNATNLESSTSKPYTVTSIDLDGDNEPNCSYILRFNGRQEVHPVRADFINIPGLGMAQKSTGGTGSYNFGIMIPKKWFESTNTSLFRFTQLEYEHSNKSTTDALIVQGGVMEQWVSSNQKGTSNKIPYIHVGGNVWFKEFHTGCHQDKDTVTLHPPISVTGGDYDEFYLTGLYVSCTNSKADNAECYINGGRFGTVCGAAMEGIGKTDGADNTGNITWQIQNADIKEFYAGALNAARPATGNLSTTITNSHVDVFCGGPKFGDMSSGKTVTTTATGCSFGTFFGAGYGGNSYSRQAPRNHNNIVNFPHNDKDAGNDASWNAWLARFYTQSYSGTYRGVSTQFNYQFLPMSDNKTNVARIFVEYVKFSLATTRNVTSNLKHCTIENNFYGGGSLGKVDGTVTSTLDSCNVQGNVFGAGFSASLPTVEVDSIGGFQVEPYYYEQLGTYRTGVKGRTTTFRWEHSDNVSSTATAIQKNVENDSILYTTEDLDALGTVQGNVTLTLTGNTTVGTLVGNSGSQTLKPGTGNVYGGGDESGVLQIDNNTPAQVTVILRQGTTVFGNVYGGGNEGPVGGNSSVIIQDPQP